MFDDRETARGKKGLGDCLVHGDGGRQHPRTHVGHVGQLEQTLHRPVLAVGPVQDREHHIEPKCPHHGPPITRFLVVPVGLDGEHLRVGWVGEEVHIAVASLAARQFGEGPGLFDDLGGRAGRRGAVGQRPASVAADTDRDRFVSYRVEVGDDRGGRGQRHFVLTRPPAIDDADPDAFHS